MKNKKNSTFLLLLGIFFIIIGIISAIIGIIFTIQDKEGTAYIIIAGALTACGITEIVISKINPKDNEEKFLPQERVCPNCKTENAINDRFCKKCGKELILKCPICKTENEMDAKYCTHCGRKF